MLSLYEDIFSGNHKCCLFMRTFSLEIISVPLYEDIFSGYSGLMTLGLFRDLLFHD